MLCSSPNSYMFYSIHVKCCDTNTRTSSSLSYMLFLMLGSSLVAGTKSTATSLGLGLLLHHFGNLHVRIEKLCSASV